ncbi:hypothetical protein BHM03_00008784, partial [Ensete ventricosum]
IYTKTKRHTASSDGIGGTKSPLHITRSSRQNSRSDQGIYRKDKEKFKRKMSPEMGRREGATTAALLVEEATGVDGWVDIVEACLLPLRPIVPETRTAAKMTLVYYYALSLRY